jgi:hypothetical protein
MPPRLLWGHTRPDDQSPSPSDIRLRRELPGTVLPRVADAMAMVAAQRTEPREWSDPRGRTVRRHDFDGFAVLTPPVATPSD